MWTTELSVYHFNLCESLGLSVFASNNLSGLMVNSEVVFEPFCTLLKKRKQSEVDGWKDGEWILPSSITSASILPSLPISSLPLPSPPLSSPPLLKWSVSNCPFGCLSHD